MGNRQRNRIYEIDITVFTERGVERLKACLVDNGAREGGVRQLLIDAQCNPDMIQRMVANERKSTNATAFAEGMR